MFPLLLWARLGPSFAHSNYANDYDGGTRLSVESATDTIQVNFLFNFIFLRFFYCFSFFISFIHFTVVLLYFPHHTTPNDIK